MNRPFVRVMLISHIGVGLAFLLHGCIGVPVPSKILEEYIPEDSLSFLDVGLTTKVEVIEKLAEPASTFANGSKWIYRANKRSTSRWAGCAYIVVDAACGVAGLYEQYGLLDLDFDDRGVLSDWKLSYAPIFGCSEKGVCAFLNEVYMIFTSESTDLAAKRFDVPGTDCAIYLYPEEGLTIRDWTDPMRVQIEDVFDTWLRDSSETYLYRVLPAASYQVTTAFESPDKSIQLACNAGDVVFIRFLKNIGDDDYHLEVATESDGRAAIERRRLILFEDITPLTSSP